jgi:hypothetical protein
MPSSLTLEQHSHLLSTLISIPVRTLQLRVITLNVVQYLSLIGTGSGLEDVFSLSTEAGLSNLQLC